MISKPNRIRSWLRRRKLNFLSLRTVFIGNSKPSPLFILGNQKSGTTAVAALLAIATKKSVALDLPEMNEPIISWAYREDSDFKTIIKYYLSPAFAKNIIKEPGLTLLFEKKIQNLYPNSPKIFIVRHPLQNIRSQLDWVKYPGDLDTFDIKKAELTPERLRVFNNEGQDFGADYIRILAQRWCDMADVYLRNQEDMILVKYEDFIQKKSTYIASLAAKLNWEIVHDISSEANTEFQPKGKNQSKEPIDFFKKKNYETILEICGERMAKFGYII